MEILVVKPILPHNEQLPGYPSVQGSLSTIVIVLK